MLVDDLVGHLGGLDHVEGKGHGGLVGGEHIPLEGHALHDAVAAAAGIGLRVVAEDDKIVLLRVAADGGCAVVGQEVPLQLGEGDAAVPVVIRAVAAGDGQPAGHRRGEVPCAHQRLVLIPALPEPAFLRPAGGAEHLVLCPLEHVVVGGVHALADDRAGVARVQDQHLGAGDGIEDCPQLRGGDALLPVAVGEQQGHLPGGGALLPETVGADVEVAHIPGVRAVEGGMDQLLQLRRAAHVAPAGDQVFQVHGAAGEGLGHAGHVVGGGGGGGGLGDEVVAAHQQGAVKPFRQDGGAEKARACQRKQQHQRPASQRPCPLSPADGM